MTWNYRAVRRHHADDSVTYHIHEVYYRDDGGIESWTEEPVAPMGEELAELREDITYFIQAFRHPVLELRNTDGDATLNPEATEDTINPGHYFEFLDRTSVAGAYLHQFLGSHPVLRREEALRAAYERAADALAELYQHAGGLAFDKDR